MNAPVPIDFNTRVAQYVKLRDKIKAIKDKHKEELAPYENIKEGLAGILLNHLNTINADSVSSPSGNVHRTMKKSASIVDMTAFWTWVVTQGKFEFVDKKANVTAVEDYIKEQIELAKTDPTILPVPPPGINFSQIAEVGVRRATK